jgi:hypothetical protein
LINTGHLFRFAYATFLLTLSVRLLRESSRGLMTSNFASDDFTQSVSVILCVISLLLSVKICLLAFEMVAWED